MAELRQATLVAFYGRKPGGLERLIAGCQAIISESLPADFRPYSMEQIHGTIVGLEKTTDKGLVNRNRSKLTARREEMDIPGFARRLYASGRFPIHIRLGGFERDQLPFTSRRQSPYDRSFSIQTDKAVVMGWPISTTQFAGRLLAERPTNSGFPQVLDDIRRFAGSFNIAHAYHRTADDTDNDFYLRLGYVNADNLHETVKQVLHARARQWLSRNPAWLDMSLSDIKFASYVDESLPPESTRMWSVSEVSNAPRLVSQLYS